MATPLAVERAGGRVVFADCSRRDLCLSLDSVKAAVTPDTRAVMAVHIGGHLTFEIEEIAGFCRDRGILLLEDCAHAHGASLRGMRGGSFGFGGAYSFYATKTLPTGEGGMVVSRDGGVIDFVRRFRNYGKPDYAISGFHGRMTELTAALGLAQMERFPEILRFKRDLARRYDSIFPNRVRFPDQMESGYYKYVVFDTRLKEETGKVYSDLCHTLRKQEGHFPDSEWVASHHTCPPIWYRYDGASLTPEALRARLMA
jgi:dTDP-4-amino-4,6-dideoxygalactose transaminase